MKESPFSKLSDDIVLNILLKLEDDPRHWSRLACVSTKFSSLIRTLCWRSHCLSIIPSVAADLSLPASSSSASDQPLGGWAALHKIAVCCPGLHHAGVLLENSDFGLERELGPDDIYHQSTAPAPTTATATASSAADDPGLSASSCSYSYQNDVVNTTDHDYNHSVASSDLCWSLYDDLYFDTVYDNSDSHDYDPLPEYPITDDADETTTPEAAVSEGSFAISKKRKMTRPMRSHLASGAWSLNREQGNKLLASRFRGDTLYICDWPGCVHMEEKRNYMVFRGIFKNFKRSRVWRTINDGQRSKIELNCAFCGCKETWDLHSAFCLRSIFGYHEDGEPVVRAYVCENGHVSGAWTDIPLYT